MGREAVLVREWPVVGGPLLFSGSLALSSLELSGPWTEGAPSGPRIPDCELYLYPWSVIRTLQVDVPVCEAARGAQGYIEQYTRDFEQRSAEGLTAKIPRSLIDLSLNVIFSLPYSRALLRHLDSGCSGGIFVKA